MYFVWILFILSLIWNYILSKRYIFAEDRQGGAYVFSILFLAVFQTLLVYGMMYYGMISYYKITKGAEVTYDISYLAPLPDCESKTKFVAYTYDPKEKDKYSFITLRSNGNSDYHVNLNLSDKQIRIIDKDEQDFRPYFRREVNIIPNNIVTQLLGINRRPITTPTKEGKLYVKEDQIVFLKDLDSEQIIKPKN